MPNENDLTPQQAADLLGVTAIWIRTLIRRGDIAATEFAGRHVIAAAEIERLQRQRATATTTMTGKRGGPGKPRSGRPRKIKPQVDETK